MWSIYQIYPMIERFECFAKRIFCTFNNVMHVVKGAQIGPSLKNLAERRTDIFGSEETVIGRKVCM